MLHDPNCGKASAYKVAVMIMAQYEDPALKDTLEIVPRPDSTFTLAPGEESVIYNNNLPVLDEALVADLGNGAKIIIVLGEVTYTDAFGRARRTRMRASSNNGTQRNADGSVQLHLHGSDNDAT